MKYHIYILVLCLFTPSLQAMESPPIAQPNTTLSFIKWGGGPVLTLAALVPAAMACMLVAQGQCHLLPPDPNTLFVAGLAATSLIAGIGGIKLSFSGAEEIIAMNMTAQEAQALPPLPSKKED